MANWKWLQSSLGSTDAYGGMYLSSGTSTRHLGTLYPHVRECHICTEPIPENRKGKSVHCSDACDRAAAVAARLAGPERGDYNLISSLSTVYWATISTKGSTSILNIRYP